MKFGVIIRSIGERTEQLCYESANIWVPDEHIHVVRNIAPSYEAYRQMLIIAREQRYDWFLGLDADVVLTPNWMDHFRAELLKSETNLHKIFKFTFPVKDRITNEILFRGIHFYNGAHIEKYFDYLEKVIRASKYPLLYRLIGKKQYFLKPESSFADIAKDKDLLEHKSGDALLGLHGFEQFYKEIFRQYATRHQRDRGFAKKYPSVFETNTEDKALNKEREVAILGWDWASNISIGNVSKELETTATQVLLSNNVKERSNLALKYNDFLTNYSQYLTGSTKKNLALEHIMHLARKGDLVIDIGANVGNVSVEFLKIGCRVHSYEPDPNAYTELEKQVSKFSTSNIYKCAVLDKEGVMNLYFHNKASEDPLYWSIGSSLIPEKSNVNKESHVEVNVLDIADVVRKMGGRIRILKIDVEGAEYKILERLIETGLVGNIDYIFVETHQHKIQSMAEVHKRLVSKIRDLGINNIYLGWV